MSKHLEGVKKILSPEAFEDFKRRVEPVLHMREEIAEKFRDINPPGTEHLAPDGMCVDPWMVVWIRERGGLDVETWHRLQYEEFVEWAYRNIHSISICQKATSKHFSVGELIQAEWLCHLSQPPAYLTRPDLGFESMRYLYGDYATTMWLHVDYWKGEFDWIEGFHNEHGVPVQYWMLGVGEGIAQHFDGEDRETLLTPGEKVSAPRDPSYLLEVRDPSTGIKIREAPKRSPYVLHEWVRIAREVIDDLRGEMFRKWIHANLYLSVSPGQWGVGTQQNFWAISGFWMDPWIAMRCTELFGMPIQFYLHDPAPEALTAVIGMSREACVRTMGELFLQGPKGLLCDAVNKMATSPKKTPLLHSIRKLMFDEGKMFKGFALPHDRGIPPPRALLTALPAPLYKETTIEETRLIENPSPEFLSKEYIELLESEAGVDFKTGRVPSYEEVPRLKWLFDPTIEWLKPSDFPPLDWSKGQVWPIDITREKMEIMVEEGYDGSGKDILHYSCLADRKLGQYGKTITLGTMSYKLPTE